MEPVRLPKFKSGRRDLNPGPLVPETSALPSCATARMNLKKYPLFWRPESLNCRRDLRPTHPPLRFAETPPGWLTWVLAHPRNEPAGI